jgi:putative lipoic acid-binding regulatory protein
MNEEQEKKLRIALASVKWPALYPFKFIVPLEQMQKVQSVLNQHETQTKVSRKGAYVSVSCTSYMLNEDKVLEVYKQMWDIKGIIAL